MSFYGFYLFWAQFGLLTRSEADATDMQALPPIYIYIFFKAADVSAALLFSPYLVNGEHDLERAGSLTFCHSAARAVRDPGSPSL